MTRLRIAAFALCALACAAATADDTPAMKMDAAKLVGSYKIVGGTTAGDKMTEEGMKAPITFAKDKITMKSDATTFVFSYKLDPSATPTTIDMTILEPDSLKGKESKGIIKMDGKTLTLTLAYDPEGKETPKEFKSTKKNGFYTFELEKTEMAKGKGKGKKKKKDD